MKLDSKTYNQVIRYLDGILKDLKGANDVGESREFMATARNRIVRDSDKYSTCRLKPQDVDTIFKYFTNSIEQVEAFYKLLSGKLVVIRVGAEEIELAERGVYADTHTIKFRYRHY